MSGSRIEVTVDEKPQKLLRLKPEEDAKLDELIRYACRVHNRAYLSYARGLC